jgi:isoleucyl-tRNA synthetase
MDAKGMKMSKSLGNTISPLDLMRDYGADILRLWALSVDFTEDHRIGKEILAGVADQYRKLRNTFRYLLGALDGFAEENASRWPTCRNWSAMSWPFWPARRDLAAGDRRFRLQHYVRALTEFCNEDLSAFFFDIRKDSLYCDAPDAAPPRLSHGARHVVPRAGPLCGAGPGLHVRGSLGHPLSARGQRAPA